MPVDISMPRDLLRRRKATGYAAICVVGFDADPAVVRIATAENIEGHLAALQPGTWHRLHFMRVVWTPGLVVARTIVIAAEKFLTGAGFHLGHHWYRVGLDVVDDLVRAETIRLRAKTWTHADLIALLRQEANRQADRFAEGRF